MSDSAAPATAPFACARRELLLGAGVGGVALVAAGCGSSSKNSTPAPAATGGGAQGIIAMSKVPADSAVSVQDSTGRTLLITQSGGKLTALDATCTHMQCTVGVSGDHLACPCHGSMYTLTGQVTQGPAPKALATVSVKVSSGQVVLA